MNWSGAASSICLGGAQQLIEAHVQPASGLVKWASCFHSDLEEIAQRRGGVLTRLEGVEQAIAGAPIRGCGANHWKAIDPARGDVCQSILSSVGLKPLGNLLTTALWRPASAFESIAGPPNHANGVAAVGGGDGGRKPSADLAGEAGGRCVGRSLEQRQ